jgi:hypothetical protein
MIHGVTTLSTRADVRALIERHLPPQHREQPAWHVAAERRQVPGAETLRQLANVTASWKAVFLSRPVGGNTA